MQNATRYNISNSKQLQNSPIDLHILGKEDSTNSTTNWDAKGHLVNDDGETTVLDGFVNYDKIQATHKIGYGLNEIQITFSN